ncbi:MAG TPA: DNA polymerase III subunit chi [Janthinobacterium sp.]|nr:DNA polymerase III subunit chi [Janthinobacterium sp.]
MTRIDFHTNVPDKLAYACRLARKAYMAHNKVVLLTEDARQLATLNAALWTFSDTDFLPHVLADDALAPQTPIVLTASDSEQLPHFDILVNLSRHPPANFARFQRLFEIVSADQDDAAAGRQRYAFYKRQDFQPTHFVAGKT